METDIRIQDFIRYLGHDPLLVEYPVWFHDRRVFKYSQGGQPRVSKIRPEDEKAYIELEKAQLRFPFNGIHCISYDTNNGLFALDMPWLGLSMSHLSDIILGYDEYYDFDGTLQPLYGFNRDEIDRLIDDLTSRMYNFASNYGLVHNDLFANGAPNNIVFIPGTSYLSLIDPEAFCEYSENSWQIFLNRMEQVRIFMYEYLTPNS